MITYAVIEENARRLESKWPGRKTFSARTVSEVLEIKYEDFIALVRSGVFPAWKESGTWSIPLRTKGCPLEWAQQRRYDNSRRYKVGKVPLGKLLDEIEQDYPRDTSV